MNRDLQFDAELQNMSRDERKALYRREMGDASGSSYGCRNYQYRLVKVAIFDRSSNDGKYPGIEKKNALLQALFEMMYRELLSDSKIQPKFNWNGMVEGVFRAVAVGEKSADFLKDLVEKMPPPWPGARLHVVYKTSKKLKIEAYVPGPLITVVELYDVIRDYDRRFHTEKWENLDVRQHNMGNVFTFTIDPVSFERLERCNGFIRYYEGGIEFRVLKD